MQGIFYYPAWLLAETQKLFMALPFFPEVHAFVTQLSLSSSLATVWGSVGIIAIFFVHLIDALRTPTSERTPLQWVMIGISVAYAGDAVDNSYWWLAWDSRLHGYPFGPQLFDNGVFSNIIFRQGFTAYAVYCHVRSVGEIWSRHFNLWVTLPWVLSGLYFVGLLWER